MKWGSIRERFISFYPGTRGTGVAFWVMDDSRLRAASYGFASLTTVQELTGRFRPDSIIVEGVREGKTTSGGLPVRGVESIWFARPSWRQHRARIPGAGRVGPYVSNAWAIGWDALIRRGVYKLSGPVRPAPFDLEWLAKWSPPVTP